MRLSAKYIKLENFGPHRSLEFVPSPHLTAVVGRNGSGKTTVLAAMELLLTGTCPIAGNKDENISCHAGERDRSRVIGHFDCGPHTVEIVRGLRRARTEMTIDDGEPILGDRPVGEALVELLGPTTNLLAEYVFVKQGRISAFLDVTDAARAKVFAVLFGTRKAEDIWNLVGREAATIEVPQRSAELDILRRRLADDREVLATLRERRTGYNDVKEYVREADPNHAIVEQRRVWTQATADHEEARAEVDRLVGQLTTHREALKKAEAGLLALEASRPGVATRADKAKVALATWKTVERAVKVRDALLRRRLALMEEQDANPRPGIPAGYIPVDDAQKEELARCRADAEWHRKFLNALANGVTACPTCGTAVDDLADAIADSQEELPFLEQMIARLDARLRAAGDHEKRMGLWDAWKDGFHQRVEQLHADEAQLAEEPPAPAEGKDDLQRVIFYADELEGAIVSARQAAALLARGVANLTGQWEVANARVDQAAGRRRKNCVSQEVYEPAVAALAAVEARLQERGKIVGEIKARKERVGLDEAMLGRLEAEEAAMTRTRGLLVHLGAIRGVLHRDALPRTVARSYLGLIEKDINGLLDEFDAGFRVSAGEDLAFTALFNDGRHQPAARLSGGQKVLLSLAFRVAVNIYFTGDIGMLALDEPTEWLDEKNIQCLEVSLRKLREVSAARGLQCLLVTHERRLTHLFDEVVTLN